METANYKFCPRCQLGNRVDAIICEHCGELFESTAENYLRTTQVNKESKIVPQDLEEQEEERASRLAPAEGIAIFILGQSKPIGIRLEKEFIIGRSIEATKERVVGLTSYDAYALGVSRRHLMVRRVGNGYEVVDLGSRNGTWVNEQRLVPQSPLSVKSGSRIRLGNLRIVITFRSRNSG
jgi:pSer/pThr/pTyr-binding forkhead associated (FHA) protein